jgi:hypothetical protein
MMMNNDRTRRSSSGCHITVGDVAPQIVVAHVIGCVVRSVVWCGAMISNDTDGDNIGNAVTVRRSSMSRWDC